ncbi:MAG: hypothetical protein ACXVRS_14705, partial [Gaiellaceae bacterium]
GRPRHGSNAFGLARDEPPAFAAHAIRARETMRAPILRQDDPSLTVCDLSEMRLAKRKAPR